MCASGAAVGIKSTKIYANVSMTIQVHSFFAQLFGGKLSWLKFARAWHTQRTVSPDCACSMYNYILVHEKSLSSQEF